MGWLRILSRWVGASGQVVGIDIDPNLLQAGRGLVEAEGLSNVRVLEDDLFASTLEPRSFDLVHARFQLAPLGRVEEQLAAYRRFLRTGGTLVLEEPETSSWRLNPRAPAAERLIELVREAFARAGGDTEVGRRLPERLRGLGAEPTIDAHVLALPPRHPYLRLPLQFTAALEQRLLTLVSAAELETVRSKAEAELADPTRWGTTFTLIQAYGTSAAEDVALARLRSFGNGSCDCDRDSMKGHLLSRVDPLRRESSGSAREFAPLVPGAQRRRVRAWSYSDLSASRCKPPRKTGLARLSPVRPRGRRAPPDDLGADQEDRYLTTRAALMQQMAMTLGGPPRLLVKNGCGYARDRGTALALLAWPDAHLTLQGDTISVRSSVLVRVGNSALEQLQARPVQQPAPAGLAVLPERLSPRT